MKEELLKTLIQRVKRAVMLFKDHEESQEYKEAVAIYEAVERADLSSLEEKAEKFTSNGAKAWLQVWSKMGIYRVYLNVICNNGYKPNMKDNYIELDVKF